MKEQREHKERKMEIVSQEGTSKTNMESRKRKSMGLEEKETEKRKNDEQKEGKKQKRQETEEKKEAQKGPKEKGKHTYSLRYTYHRSGRFKVEDMQPD